MKTIAAIWCGLALLRVLWTLWPQNGYIHPDEFFQSTEVAAGDMFHFDVLRTWEFTNSQPIRSIVPIGIVCCSAFSLLLLASTLLGYSSILTPYTLLISTRFTVTILSFMGDYSIYKICNAIGHRWDIPLIVYGSSYVTLVYYTRTFSNTVESFLLAALLSCVLKSGKKICVKYDMDKNMSVTSETCESTENKEFSEKMSIVNQRQTPTQSQDTIATSEMCDTTENNKSFNYFGSQKVSSKQPLSDDSKYTNSERIAVDGVNSSESIGAITSNSSTVFNDNICKKSTHLVHSKYGNKDKSVCDEQNNCSTADIDISYMQYVTVSFVLTLGIFNRPTFVLFAVIPGLHWLLLPVLSGSSWIYVMSFVMYRGCILVIFISFWIFLFILADSVYYGSLSFSYITESFATLLSHQLSGESLVNFAEHFSNSVLAFDVTFRNLTVTPLNFVLYNLASDNLAEHGIHPRYTHVFVNMPLLFSILAFCFFFDTTCSIFHIIRSRVNIRQLVKAILSQPAMLILTCLVSLVLLSVFPHQEARFLIPLLVPLAVLYSRQGFSSKILLVVWLFTNTICALLFGLLHQGGVVSSLSYMSEYSTTYPSRIEAVVFWKTYMPPRYLLMRCADRNDSSVFPVDDNISVTFTNCSPSYEVHDLAGRPNEELLNLLLSLNDRRFLHKHKLISPHTFDKDIFVVFPATVYQDILSRLNKGVLCSKCKTSDGNNSLCEFNSGRLELALQHSLFPHLSMEDTPILNNVVCENQSYIDCLHKQLSLNIYKIMCTDSIV